MSAGICIVTIVDSIAIVYHINLLALVCYLAVIAPAGSRSRTRDITCCQGISRPKRSVRAQLVEVGIISTSASREHAVTVIASSISCQGRKLQPSGVSSQAFSRPSGVSPSGFTSFVGNFKRCCPQLSISTGCIICDYNIIRLAFPNNCSTTS